MLRRKRFLLLAFVLVLGLQNTFRSQSNIAILLNEYSASNVGGPADVFGSPSDWVELKSIHTTSVSLGSYYLSNDRNNLFKWKFPSSFVLFPNQIKAVWLSGKNTVKSGEYHANFTLEQCKNQWLILSTDQGVVRDSVFVQKTKAGHTRGRIDPQTKGVSAWRLYLNHSFLFENPLVNYAVGYAPTPRMYTSPLPAPSATTNQGGSGGFYGVNAGVSPNVYFKLENNLAYDSAFSCFSIYYTTDGTFPVPGQGNTTLYPDSVTGSQGALTLANTTMVRAIAVSKNTPNCAEILLPSFCETNTYFIDLDHNKFQEEFGVVSLAMDPAWFNSSGAFTPTIHAEYYDKKMQVSEGYAQVNKPAQEEWRTKQKGMYINLDDRQGFGCAFEGNIFNVPLLGTTDRTVFPTLHLKSGDFESSSPRIGIPGPTDATGIRDVLVQSIAAKNNINVNPLHIKPVITFVNGKYYGVYDLREVYDKYYENYYNSQSKDSLTLAFFHNTDGAVTYVDGTNSNFNNNFKTKVFDFAMGKPLNSTANYNLLMAELDKSSFIDYMILNSYIMNSNLWNYDVAYAKGGQTNLPGGKWHYYLWNVPTAFNYTSALINTYMYSSPYEPPCRFYSGFSMNTLTVTPLAGNGHAPILDRLMNPINGNKSFQADYKNRLQDLLNGPLKCENILKQFDDIAKLYEKEMRYHSDPTTGLEFGTVIAPDLSCWDSNMVKLRNVIDKRCYHMQTTFTTSSCYGFSGPHNITVDVKPDSSAGRVQLNTVVLPFYPWTGKYYTTMMTFQAIPTTTAYVFDHWELVHPQNVVNLAPLSMDSIGFSFNQAEEVIAVFTDKTKDLVGQGEGSNVPTGFTPNGDGLNDFFRPLGAAKFTTEYEMTIWSRWGEEVFRSTTPETAWDGNYKGQPAITGVYAYIIKYKNVFGESKLLKGNVTLSR